MYEDRGELSGANCPGGEVSGYRYNILFYNSRPIVCQVVALSVVENKRKFQTFSSKSGVVAYMKWPLKNGPKYGESLANFWYLEKLVAEER